MTNNFERRTVAIQNEIESKIRELQGDLIKTESKSWNYSKVINLVLLSGLMGNKSLDASQWELCKRLVEGGKVNLDCSIEEYIDRLSKVT